jgi:hypothetical protein
LFVGLKGHWSWGPVLERTAGDGHCAARTGTQVGATKACAVPLGHAAPGPCRDLQHGAGERAAIEGRPPAPRYREVWGVCGGAHYGRSQSFQTPRLWRYPTVGRLASELTARCERKAANRGAAGRIAARWRACDKSQTDALSPWCRHIVAPTGRQAGFLLKDDEARRANGGGEDNA